MRALHFFLCPLLTLAMSTSAAAQSRHALSPVGSPVVAAPTGVPPRLNLTVPPEQLIPSQAARLPTSAALHPAARGTIIGGAAGAGFWGAIAVWYCTVGPNEVGECDNAGQWMKGIAVFGAAGAAIGAAIGAIAANR